LIDEAAKHVDVESLCVNRVDELGNAANQAGRGHLAASVPMATLLLGTVQPVVIADRAGSGLRCRDDIQERFLDLAGVYLALRIEVQKLAIDGDPEHAAAGLAIMSRRNVQRLWPIGPVVLADGDCTPHVLVAIHR
jgi:hypothetical protein